MFRKPSDSIETHLIGGRVEEIAKVVSTISNQIVTCFSDQICSKCDEEEEGRGGEGKKARRRIDTIKRDRAKTMEY
jgi:hypothetical protein